MRPLLPISLLGLLGVYLPAPAAQAGTTEEELTLLVSTGPIGTLKVRRTLGEGNETVDVDWRVDDNGRGSKQQEHVELSAAGLPVRWRITGKGWFGAPVEETFAVQGAKATWRSLDGGGEGPANDALYLAKDGTPWSLGIYARALLKAKSGTRRALPGGTLRIEKIRDVELGSAREKATAYVLWGLDLTPTVVLMDGDRYRGFLQPGLVLVDSKHKGSFAALSALAAELSGSLLERLTTQVTHELPGPLWITRVRVFDPKTQKLGAETSVVVDKGRIVALRTDAPPAGVSVVDGGGGTLLPGLIDAHAHQWDWGGPYHIAAGVTFVRDPGNDIEMVKKLQADVESGRLIGPRSRIAGFLEGKSPYSAGTGFIVSTQEEALEKVRWYAQNGFVGVKIYNSMNPAYVKAIASEAHKLGLHVSGHVPAFMSSEEAIAAGYDEIHHINQLLLSFVIDPKKDDTRTPFRFTALGERLGGLDLQRPDVQRVLRTMKEKNVALDPTIATFSPLLQSRPGQAPPSDAGWLDHMPVPVQRQRKSAVLDVKPEQYPLYEKSWAKIEEALRLIHAQGITLLPGTDDAAGFVLHSELEAWVKAGIPAPAVLSAATLGGARFLGWEQELGSVEPGKRADLLLVDGDPTKDISAVRRAKLVVKGDRYYWPDEIHTALGVKPWVAHAAVRAP